MTALAASGIALRKWVLGWGMAASAFSALAQTCFDDVKLVQASGVDTVDVGVNLAQSNWQGRLLYVWSPRMVLSAQYAASAQRQAVLQGLQFVALHDANVPEAELRAALGRLQHSDQVQYATSAQALAQSQPLCAQTLLQRNALRHFPTAFVQRTDGLHRHAIIGAMPEAAWASSIAQRLTVLTAQQGKAW
jgi:hypothetical protein